MHTSQVQGNLHARRLAGLPGLAAAIAAALLSQAAVAQTGADARAARSEVLEEVTVTAQRREQSLMDVPLAVSAFTGEELERFGALDLVALTNSVPNTTLEASRATNSTLTAFIRGVGQQDPVAGFESGVGIYIDDVYLNRPQAALLDIYDVERIEVLRGPQGTLYGRNTIGGAIKYVTRHLSDEPELKARGRVGNYSMYDVVLTGSMPLSDTFQIGGSVASFNRDGFGENLYLGLDNYSKDWVGARLSAEWAPGEDWFLRLTADWFEDDSDPKQGHRLTVGRLSGAPVLDDVYDSRAGLAYPIQTIDGSGTSLLTEWTAGDMVLFRGIFATRQDDGWSPIDFDSLPSGDLDVPVYYDNSQDSAELQAVISADRLNGVVGLYYLDADAFNYFEVLLANTGALIGLPGLNASTLGDVNTETWSVFADFTYDFSDQWSVSAGGRYTDDQRTSTVMRQTWIGGFSSYFGGSAIPIVTTSDFHGSQSYTDFTPRLSVQWHPNPDQNLYATYSEGFKGGSFDPRGQTSATPDFNGDGMISADEVFEFMAFEPEEVESLEFGAKSTLFGGRMTSSLAIFFADYTDVQVPGSEGVDTDGDGVNDTFTGVTTNAGAADMSGVEWEGQAILANDIGANGADLNLAWAIGYIDAEYTEFEVGGQNLADQHVIQNTPEWTAAGTLTYNLPVSWFNSSGLLGFITTLSYRGEHSQFETSNQYLDQDAYTLWDLSVVWSDDSGYWQVGLHGKNLTDEQYIVAGYYFPYPTLGLEETITAFYGNPRQYWLDVQYRWF